MVSYRPLRHILVDRNIKKMQLLEMIGGSSRTVAKLSNDEPVALSVLERVAVALGVEIGDLVEIIPDTPTGNDHD